MKILNADNTYMIKTDANGEILEAQFCDNGTSVITNTDVVKTEAIKVNNLTTKEVDYALNDAAEKGILGDLLILESEPRSAASDLAVEKLVADGKTIITVQ